MENPKINVLWRRVKVRKHPERLFHSKRIRRILTQRLSDRLTSKIYLLNKYNDNNYPFLKTTLQKTTKIHRKQDLNKNTNLSKRYHYSELRKEKHKTEMVTQSIKVYKSTTNNDIKVKTYLRVCKIHSDQITTT